MTKTNHAYPKISIITPSYNQADFLERTILSVLDQNYPNLEYIIIDGGSTDASIDVIRKYEGYLTYWVSEKDNGQSHAINKGIEMATGEWIAWQNSDDIYYSGAFKALVKAATGNPKANLIVGNMNLIDEHDGLIWDLRFVKPSYGSMVAEGMTLSNQSAFWKRNMHNEIGMMDENLHLGFDFDWFLKLTKVAEGVSVNECLGAFRIHSQAKTQKMMTQNLATHQQVRQRHHVTMPRWEILLFKIRRFLLLLARGDLQYVLRGLVRRFNKAENVY